MSRNAYSVKYKMHEADEIKMAHVIASNKEEAWDVAVFERIPEIEGHAPYSAWTYGVTYNNGNYRTFNTFEGKPF